MLNIFYCFDPLCVAKDQQRRLKCPHPLFACMCAGFFSFFFFFISFHSELQNKLTLVFYVLQGYTPLHIAALHGHRHIQELLTETYGKRCFLTRRRRDASPPPNPPAE